ncbi:MAG: hypothetical protein A2173_02820 [Planctomycetes bacterium RBG_13_44_8b]|nr:MAG: hypothetical protein A2173_02820 [Planctomycetes bacterium RBG_13_44_8b]
MFSLNRKTKTDDEFICMIRKNLKISPKIAIFQFIMAFALLAAILWLVYGIINLTLVEDSEISTPIWIGLAFGMILGFVASTALAQVTNFVKEAITNFEGERRNRLLIKYYDALKELAEGENG